MKAAAKRISILVADDYPIFRVGLRVLIEREPDFILAGEARDEEETVTLTRRLAPDILLLSATMAKQAEPQALKRLVSAAQPTRVVLLLASSDDARSAEALRSGARGVVLKDISDVLFAKAIRCVHSGEFWLGQRNVNGLIQALRLAHTEREEDPAIKFGLTKRELQVIDAIAEGHSNRVIADRLAISEQTVKHHVSSIFEKVGVSSRLQLVVSSANQRLGNRGQGN